MIKKGLIKLQFWSALLLIIGITVIFIFYSPKELLQILGVTNTYIFTFALSLMAGIMFLTSAFFYGTIVALVLSGFNPLILGLVAGGGLFIGDSFVFYLGKKGRDALDLNDHPKIAKFSQWLIKQPYKMVILFIVLYGLTPFPNEILMLSLSVLGYEFKKVWIPLLIADVILVTAIGYLALMGIKLF